VHAAAASIPLRLHCIVGLGVDSFHQCCDAASLRAIAELRRSGAYLGAVTLLPSMLPVQRYIEAVNAGYETQMPPIETITNASVVAAIEGHFGCETMHHRTKDQWINPQMAVMRGFRAQGVADRILPELRNALAPTFTRPDVSPILFEQRELLLKQKRIRTREEYPKVPSPR
jgi:hypothetical protein